MHVVPVPNPLVCLRTNLSLFSFLVSLRHKSLPIKVVAQILGDKARLSENQRLGGVFVLDANDGGLSEGMDFLKFLGSKHVGTALEGFEFVGNVEFFEEPEDALGAGLLQPWLG